MADAHVEHGNMVRDERDEWPADEPIGSFDINAGPGHSVQGYPGANGHIIFVCPNNRRCSVLVGPSPVERPSKDACYVWGWNGDKDRPTLTPSINCRSVDDEGKASSGCGWHGHIIDGVIR